MAAVVPQRPPPPPRSSPTKTPSSTTLQESPTKIDRNVSPNNGVRAVKSSPVTLMKPSPPPSSNQATDEFKMKYMTLDRNYETLKVVAGKGTML
jgi:hypothetical protein